MFKSKNQKTSCGSITSISHHFSYNLNWHVRIDRIMHPIHLKSKITLFRFPQLFIVSAVEVMVFICIWLFVCFVPKTTERISTKPGGGMQYWSEKNKSILVQIHDPFLLLSFNIVRCVWVFFNILTLISMSVIWCRCKYKSGSSEFKCGFIRGWLGLGGGLCSGKQNGSKWYIL